MRPVSIEKIQQTINEKIPKGLIVPAHDEFGHHYMHTPTGMVFDSVTTQMSGVIDNPNLKVWAARLAVEHISNKLTFNVEMLKDGVAMEKLQDEAVMVHRDTFEDAGGIGTVGHSAVEAYNLEWMATKVQPTDIAKYISGEDSREWAILRSAVEFYNDFYYLPVASELLVCNTDDAYAGTLDCLGFIIVPERKCTSVSGRHSFTWNRSTRDWREKECSVCGLHATYQLALIDYKTSNSIQHKPTYCAQVSAYDKAFTKMTRIVTDLLIIVRLDKKQAKYEVIKISDRKDCYKAFKLMKKLSAWLKSKKDHAEPLIQKQIISIN